MVDAIAEEELDKLKARGTYRWLRSVTPGCDRVTRVDGQPVLQFVGSNYLDLARHPEVLDAAAGALGSHGCASAGSRLICGNSDLHEQLEEDLATFLGTEAALLFSTGYMANVGVLTALLRPGDVVISDALNHASLVDGCRLARADVRIFPHGDVGALGELLPRVAQEAHENRRRVVLAVDGIYSMDGDVAPLQSITRLARAYGVVILLDDAHGFGTVGRRGRGSAELLGVEGEIDVYIGALGKALGSFGAFVAGSAKLRDLLVNTARTLLFTCALAPSQVAAAQAALRIVRTDRVRRERLQDNAAKLRARLAFHGISTEPSTTQIVPVLVGQNEPVMALSERLLARGYLAQGIRHPSVPNGTARLRLTLMAAHEEEEIYGLADAIAEELPRLRKKSALKRDG